jgi:cytoskeletal protein RodZ
LLLEIMPTVAEQLRQAREARGLTIGQLADVTKIRTDHVRALEEGNYGVFSAPVYIRGFARTIASVVKLDPQKLVADVDAELSQIKKFKAAPRLTGESRGVLDYLMLQLSKLNWRIALPAVLLIVLIIAGVVGLRAWQERQNRDPLRNLGPGIYQPKRSGGETLPLPPNSPPHR